MKNGDFIAHSCTVCVLGQKKHFTEALVEEKNERWGTEGGGKLPESTALKFDVKQTTTAKGSQIQSNTESGKATNLLLLQTALSFKQC